METLGPYRLGPNRIHAANGIYYGDCLQHLRYVPSGSVDLIIADPPYYRISSEDWDKQWGTVQEWAAWGLEWGREACRVLKPNGSAYVFGDEKNLAYLQVLLDGLEWGLLNRIVWSKTNAINIKAGDTMRSYRVQGEEHILFYGKDITFPSFSEIRNPRAAQPMAAYLKAERLRAGVSVKDVCGAIGAFGEVNHGGAMSNWEAGHNFPSREQYEAIRDYLNRRNHGEYLRREYEDLRRPFFGGEFTDIWTGPIISASHKRHDSHKPAWIIDRIIQSSTKPGAVVLDLFAGSGEAGRRCKQLGRHYIGYELDLDTCRKARAYIHQAQPPLFVMGPEQMALELTA